MDEILTKKTVSITEFKANPNQVVKASRNKPFAVLTNNKPSFYVLSPKAYDDLLEYIWELKITPEVLEAEKGPFYPVDIEAMKRGEPIIIPGLDDADGDEAVA
jgi:antitoxin StbD